MVIVGALGLGILLAIVGGALALREAKGQVLAFCDAPAPARATIPSDAAPTVQMVSGVVRGSYLPDQGLYRFTGIPYAEAPVGERRFKAPEPVKPWSGVREAVAFGPPSAQAYDEHEGSLEDFGGDLTNEDSLSVNVWTPSLEGKRPVMVWLHGGGNAHSSSRLPHYDGASIAQRGDVVFVSLNYRLGIFGFVDMSLVGGDAYAGSANNGLRDQMLALQWVRQNIARFGGDPDNVTAFGNSAGASDLSAILGADNPRQYFDRLILQSGSAFLTKAPETSARMNKAFFARMGVSSIDQLKSLPAASLIEKQEAALKGMLETEVDLLFQPTMDGVVIKAFPLLAMQAGASKDIDLLIGTTANELMLYALYDPQMLSRRPQDMPELKALPAPVRNLVAWLYMHNRPDMAPGQVAMDIYTDLAFRLPAIRMAEAQTQNGGSVWMYRFDWRVPDSKVGAPHGIELPFLFDNIESIGEGFKPQPQWRSLSHSVQDAWTSFARYGDPARDAHGQQSCRKPWASYDLRRRTTMLFDTPMRVVDDPSRWERRLFSGIPFDRYSDDDR